jgi:hypothetical protein
MTDTPHARRTDAISSHLALQALGRATSLKAHVVTAALMLEDPVEVECWCDTELTAKVEQITRKRQQRNVIARTRGLLEQDGWIEKVGLFDYDGRPHLFFKLTPAAITAT